MLAVPLILFYEVSVFMAKYLYPKSMKYKEEIVSVKEKIEV